MTALAPGMRLGVFEVGDLLGEGGMGKVYQARDTKLDRDVALKVLPEAFTSDPDRLARFEREAKVLASLNHPNIGGIHGLEESDGVRALVLELIDGPTLADRIGRGPIPVDEALPIAKQIAEALEAAHEQGVIHRDLKPANIKVKTDGTVKVLDFGLAKALQPDPSGPAAADSPTISLTAATTRMGMVIGTAAYMAPEQAKGETVDQRADVWAFGAVLYEMLTGARPFAGDDMSDILAAVLRADVDLDALPDDAPGRVRQVVAGCLQRDRKQRLHHVADVRLALEGTFEAAPATGPTAGPVAPLHAWQRPVPLVVGTLLLTVSTGLAGWWVARANRQPAPTTRLSIAVPRQPVDMRSMPGTSLAVSPDGTRVVYVGLAEDPSDGVGLNVRTLETLTVRRLPGTGSTEFPSQPRQPFFSPDGLWVGFFTAEGVLRKVALDGGNPVTLVDGIDGSQWGQADWGDDDTIVFTSVRTGGLRRVAANGGAVASLTELEAGEGYFGSPHLLPGARVALFGVLSASGPHIDSLVLATGERRTVVEDAFFPVYARSGHLVFQRDDTLMAVRFDAERAATVGPEAPLVERVRRDPTGVPQLALSASGTLAYVPPVTTAFADRLMWVDEQGTPEILGAPPRGYGFPRVSADGRRVAVQIREEDGVPQIHVYDLAREVLTSVTQGVYPLWTPDGESVVFGSVDDSLLSMRVDGSAEPDVLVAPVPGATLSPGSWTADGQRFAYITQDAGGEDIWVLSLTDPPVSEPFLSSPYREYNPAFSPDGTWLAYASDESGQFEVYARRYPSGADRIAVTQGGGLNPVWSRDGRKLFYITRGGGLFVVPFGAASEPVFGVPRRLFSSGSGSSSTDRAIPHVPYGESGGNVNAGPVYDVSPDGDRLLMVQQLEDPLLASEIVIARNWHQELRERVPIP